MSQQSSHTDREYYVLRIMGSMVASLLVLLAAFKLWPLPGDGQPDRRIYSTRGQEIITMEEIVPTRQIKQTPPPPAPLPPIIVPDDVIIEDFELDISDSFLPTEEPGTALETAPGDVEGTPTSLASVTVGPKVVRIVEPKYTREALKKGVRAEAVIEVLVDATGHVEDTRILERYLIKGKNDEKELVDVIGYGVEEALLAAAERWMFRPARQNGKPVTSYTRVTLGVGKQ